MPRTRLLLVALGLSLSGCGDNLTPEECEVERLPLPTEGKYIDPDELTLPGCIEGGMADAVDVADYGYSWNGWSQFPTGTWYTETNSYVGEHVLTRTSGDATRGGGGCFTISATVANCTEGSDTSCTQEAIAKYGTSAYGYCSGGWCYYRPGSQSTYCAVNPNRAPGTLTFSGSYPKIGLEPHRTHALGCMTKTAGPNTACGGTDASQYVRVVQGLVVDDGPNQ